MPLYKIANLVIDSSIALPSVPLARTGVGAWTFMVDRHGVPRIHPAWYHHENVTEGARWRSLAREGGNHVIRFWRRASFIVSFDARRITCYPCGSASLETIRQLLVGHVMPLVFADEGALALHASAVQSPSRSPRIRGTRGGGKSTIASALGARGCSIVADDCVIVDVAADGCRVRPIDVGLRLWPETVRMLRGDGYAANGRAHAGGRKKRVAARTLGTGDSRSIGALAAGLLAGISARRTGTHYRAGLACGCGRGPHGGELPARDGRTRATPSRVRSAEHVGGSRAGAAPLHSGRITAPSAIVDAVLENAAG